jgi:hypothetical protein
MAECETCHGQGYVLRQFSGDVSLAVQDLPCPDCMGGVSSCCDGAVPSAFEGEYQAKPINGGID